MCTNTVQGVIILLTTVIKWDSGGERERERERVGEKGERVGIVGKKEREWGIVGKKE